MSYKNIRIPKRGGGTRLQRVQVLKSGKYKFVKNLTSKPRASKHKKTASKKRKSTSKGGKKRMARKYRMTIPLAPTLGLLAGMQQAITQATSGNFNMVIPELTRNYIGYASDKQEFMPKYLLRGLLPLVIGLLVHKFVGGYLGVNRMLGRAKVPLLRL